MSEFYKAVNKYNKDMSEYKFPGLEDYNNLIDKLITEIDDKQKELVTTVLRNLFKREPTEDDFKRLTFRHSQGLNYKVHLYVDQIHIGSIQHHFDRQDINSKFTVEFTPDQKYL